MIRDKSTNKPAKKATPQEPAKVTAGKAETGKTEAGKTESGKTESGKSAAKTGIIAVAAPSFRRERALIKRGVWPVAGCDEAGRGPLAGPVVAAAVILDPNRIPRGIDDSKRLTAEERERLFDKICATAQVSVAVASRA